jgi:tetratricopeptide (TPR) repeat protein
MQECRVCELLFLGGGACPSCGSQVAIDISTEDITMDDDSIPGLDDVAEAIGVEEEITSDEGQVLPFGMGAKAEVLESSLPFGVGSVSESIHRESASNQGEELDVSTPEFEEPDTIESLPAVEVVIEQEAGIILAEVPTPEVTLPLDDLPLISEEIPVSTIEPEVMRLTADVTDDTRIIEETDDQEMLGFDEPIDALAEEAPEMWRIDAAVVDMDEIYAQDEQIIEVSFDDEMGNEDVEVNFDEFHHSAVEESMISDDESPELHPAKALPVDASGQPEVAEMIQNAFEHMGKSSWLEAAQVLSTASANQQNDSSILNNLGLALLQSALEMDSSGDPMATSQYEAAIMALRQGAKIDTQNNTILHNLAHALLVSGRAEKALGVITVLRERSSSDVEIENTLGACLIQLERKGEAKIILTPYATDTIVSANLALV